MCVCVCACVCVCVYTGHDPRLPDRTAGSRKCLPGPVQLRQNSPLSHVHIWGRGETHTHTYTRTEACSALVPPMYALNHTHTYKHT